MSTPVTPVDTGKSWTSKMEAVAARSENDALIEADVSQRVNQNSKFADAAQGIAR